VIRHFFSKQFLAFFAVGSFSAVVNFGSRILYSNWVSYPVAVVLAYITGMITAFILNALFVFTESTQPVHRSAMYFTVVNIFGASQTLVVSLALDYWVLPWLHMTWHAEEVAHAVGVAIPVFTSYLLNKFWAFK
jgi:putative flippase GtrA